MHSLENLARTLDSVQVNPFSGFVFRIIRDQWRDDPLSAIGAFRSGGRYNAPNSFPVLYCADSQFTSLREVDALFATEDGRLIGAPRNPDLILSIESSLLRVLDITDDALYPRIGTTREELISEIPSRFILNSRGEVTPTQSLGEACYFSGKISAIKVPSAANPAGFCLNIFLDSLVIGERISVLDKSGRIQAQIEGILPLRTHAPE